MPAKSVLVDHAAVLLGVSRRTVYYRIREGRLRTIRLGVTQRVLLESIDELREAMFRTGGRQKPARPAAGRVEGAGQL
jgi:excisionase family DNA binding protein